MKHTHERVPHADAGRLVGREAGRQRHAASSVFLCFDQLERRGIVEQLELLAGLVLGVDLVAGRRRPWTLLTVVAGRSWRLLRPPVNAIADFLRQGVTRWPGTVTL